MTIGSFLDKKKIRDFINKYDMLADGDGVVLGLSGGPDSVCLFFVLLELKAEYNLKIHAVHVNHMIRGTEAGADEAWVRDLCDKHDIPLTVAKIDVPRLAKASGRSLEEEARIARYEEFKKLASLLKEEGATDVKIAIAHNANDNAETILFHMARGCGLDGVAGIAPTRDKIIRPLLNVSKEEILELLEENDISYCIDKTNADVDYDRNRIRHNIMPELTEINDQALKHMSDMSQKMQEISQYINTQALGLLEMAKLEGGKLRKRSILTAPRVIASQALKLYISSYMPYKKDVSATHIENILSLLDKNGEKLIDLPYKKTMIISYEEIYLVDSDELEAKPNLNGSFCTREIEPKEGLKYPTDTYTKWFDYGKISHEIVIRTRQEGDYLTINSQGDHKSIQDYFVDMKIPRNQRDSVLLVCDGSHVIWVVGYRISEYYKVAENTSKIIEISYTEDVNNG